MYLLISIGCSLWVTNRYNQTLGKGHRTWTHNISQHAMGMGHCTPLPLNRSACWGYLALAPCPCLACDEYHGNVMGIAWESHGNIVGKMMKAVSSLSSLVKLGCIIQQTGSRPLRERVCQTLESSGWQIKWPRIGQVPLSNSSYHSYPTRSASPQVTPNRQDFPIPGSDSMNNPHDWAPNFSRSPSAEHPLVAEATMPTKENDGIPGKTCSSWVSHNWLRELQPELFRCLFQSNVAMNWFPSFQLSLFYQVWTFLERNINHDKLANVAVHQDIAEAGHGSRHAPLTDKHCKLINTAGVLVEAGTSANERVRPILFPSQNHAKSIKYRCPMVSSTNSGCNGASCHFMSKVPVPEICAWLVLLDRRDILYPLSESNRGSILGHDTRKWPLEPTGSQDLSAASQSWAVIIQQTNIRT